METAVAQSEFENTHARIIEKINHLEDKLKPVLLPAGSKLENASELVNTQSSLLFLTDIIERRIIDLLDRISI